MQAILPFMSPPFKDFGWHFKEASKSAPVVTCQEKQQKNLLDSAVVNEPRLMAQRPQVLHVVTKAVYDVNSIPRTIELAPYHVNA